MALTFDDLPYAGVANRESIDAAQAATDGILETLKSYDARAVGFVNESKIYRVGEVDRWISLLEQWVKAGHLLGNHTYSHADFNLVTVDEFQDEIVRGDVISRRLMSARAPYPLWFRHPYTHTGDTKAKKQAIEEFLTARGYRVAPHTIDSSDHVFNMAYAHALAADDRETAARVRAAYVEFVLDATGFAEGVASQIFGRDIPQLMLLHANDVNRDSLEDLLQALQRRGYRFISLDEATSDAAYRTGDKLVTRFGPSWLWRWNVSMGTGVSFKGDPEPPTWILELNRAARAANR